MKTVRITTVKPRHGCVSILQGTTSGIHPTFSHSYRRLTPEEKSILLRKERINKLNKLNEL